MAELAKQLGADDVLQQKILVANTSIEVLNLCQKSGIDIAQLICQQALIKAKSIVPASVQVEVIAINRQGEFVGSASDSNTKD